MHPWASYSFIKHEIKRGNYRHKRWTNSKMYFLCNGLGLWLNLNKRHSQRNLLFIFRSFRSFIRKLHPGIHHQKFTRKELLLREIRDKRISLLPSPPPVIYEQWLKRRLQNDEMSFWWKRISDNSKSQRWFNVIYRRDFNPVNKFRKEKEKEKPLACWYPVEINVWEFFTRRV